MEEKFYEQFEKSMKDKKKVLIPKSAKYEEMIATAQYGKNEKEAVSKRVEFDPPLLYLKCHDDSIPPRRHGQRRTSASGQARRPVQPIDIVQD
jgi:hypothetical protein